jgi:hypothetical protein
LKTVSFFTHHSHKGIFFKLFTTKLQNKLSIAVKGTGNQLAVHVLLLSIKQWLLIQMKSK